MNFSSVDHCSFNKTGLVTMQDETGISQIFSECLRCFKGHWSCNGATSLISAQNQLDKEQTLLIPTRVSDTCSDALYTIFAT